MMTPYSDQTEEHLTKLKYDMQIILNVCFNPGALDG